jgi:2'-5' RNA ligase
VILNFFIGGVVDPRGFYPERVLSEGLSALPGGLRPFHEEDLHLTIAFLGAVGEERARDAWEALEWPLGPTHVTLGALVPMGPDGLKFSALSFVLNDGRSTIEDAMGGVRDVVCDVAGASRETRAPKAHVTIARPTRKASIPERRAALAWAKTIDLSGTPLRLDTLALYGWSKDRKDRLFQKIAVRALAD